MINKDDAVGSTPTDVSFFHVSHSSMPNDHNKTKEDVIVTCNLFQLDTLFARALLPPALITVTSTASCSPFSFCPVEQGTLASKHLCLATNNILHNPALSHISLLNYAHNDQ